MTIQTPLTPPTSVPSSPSNIGGRSRQSLDLSRAAVLVGTPTEAGSDKRRFSSSYDSMDPSNYKESYYSRHDSDNEAGRRSIELPGASPATPPLPASPLSDARFLGEPNESETRTVSELRKELIKLKAKVVSNAAKEAELAKLRDQVGRLQDLCRQREDQIERLSHQPAPNDDDKAEITELRRLLAESEADIGHLNEMCGKKVHELEESREREASLRSEVQRLRTLERENTATIAELRRTLEEREAQLVRLAQQQQKPSSSRGASRPPQSQTTLHAAQLSALQSKLDLRTSDIRRKDLEISELKQRLDQAKAQVSIGASEELRLNHVIIGLVNSYETLSRTVENKTQQIMDLNHRLREEATARKGQAVEIERLRKAAAGLEIASDDLLIENASLRSREDGLRAAMRQLRDDTSKAQLEARKRGKEAVELKNEVDRQRATIREQDGMIASSQRELRGGFALMEMIEQDNR